MEKTVCLKVKKTVRYSESEGKLHPLDTDEEAKYWIELESGKVIVVKESDIWR